MKNTVIVFITILACCCGCVGLAAEAAPRQLPRSTPEAQGIASSVILEFVNTADREIAEMHSFMLLRHGHVVAEGWWDPFDAATRHQLYSLSKSFTSTAAGMAITEGKLNLDDHVLDFFPDDTYTAKICFRETPHCLTLQLKFAGDQLILDREMNVAFGPTKSPQLIGRIQPDTTAADTDLVP